MMDIYRTVSAEAAAHLQIRRGIVSALAVSLITNAALAVTLLTRTDQSRTIVLSPRAEITYEATDETVSANLLERFAADAAQLLLNMTPATAASSAETFLKHVAAVSYGTISAGVRRGADELVRNYASSVFYPMSSAVDAQALAVCINGQRRMMIASSVTDVKDITVCMRHLVSAGRLRITQLTIQPAQFSEPARALADFIKEPSADTGVIGGNPKAQSADGR